MVGRIVKRAFDIIFAAVFILVFSPIYILTPIIIMICSPGNPIYCARRVGLQGRVFKCYKFRSMRLDSGKVRLTTLQNDDRVFPFGKFIRKVKIDEMPQMVNILLGQMSVVGPRPEDMENAERIYIGRCQHIMDVKPGLTSPASLYDFTHGEKYEDEESYERIFLPRKLFLELYYVEHRTFTYDIKLIIKTAVTILCVAFGKSKFEEPNELSYFEVKGEAQEAIL